MVLAIWLYLLAGRGGFWLGRERDDGAAAARPAGSPWPAVTAVIPARDEAESVGETVSSLLRQDYPGAFNVIVVDDQSRDGTARVARDAAAALGAADRLTVLSGRTLPAGWTGKLWAQHQGVEAAATMPHPPDFLLLTDADIVYVPDELGRLVARAQAGGSVLTSLMAKLRCESFAERMFIPAFIFFFQMLYPFAWANDPRRATAAAAGGCMLVRRETLREAGGMASIRTALIDDCALAKRLKAHGPIWIGLTDGVSSARAYPALEDIRHMVSRTAYAQLRYSPLLLAGTVLGLAVTYLAPVLLAVFAGGMAQILGIAAWLLMALAFQPTLRFYRVSPLWGLALPAIAATYMAFTRGFRLSACARARRDVEGPRPGERPKRQRFGITMSDASMSDADTWRSGKGHRNENFPVASFLIHPRHRAAILAFYNFVRTADDIADHAALAPAEKLRLLDHLGAGLVGENDDDASAVRLREALAERTIVAAACAGSARGFQARRDQAALSRLGRSHRLLLAVGDAGRPLRLDVHGESRAVWPANDALCAALQIINHLQDCKDDYSNLDRVYVPLDRLSAHGVGVEALGEPRASPPLLAAPAQPRRTHASGCFATAMSFRS